MEELHRVEIFVQPVLGPNDPFPNGTARAALLDAGELEALPHVHRLTITPASKRPARQITHILNWHHVDFADFAAEIRQAEGKRPHGSGTAPSRPRL